MCAPTVEEISEKRTVDEQPPSLLLDNKDAAREQMQRGTLLGGASLGALLLASSMQFPFQQSQRDELGCDVQCQGSLSSARSTLTLIGSAAVGRWSDSAALDRYGGARRVSLFIGVVATAISIVMANRASTVKHLWISLVPTALQQNMHILKALFSDYQEATPDTTPAERAAAAGSLGMAAGLAMMIGPLAGAVLLKTYDRAAAASLVVLATAALCIYQLPVVNKTYHKDYSKKPPSRRFLSFLDVPSARTPAAIFLLVNRLLAALAFQIYQTIWTVSLRERFNFGPRDYASFMSVVGLFFALSQGVVAKRVLSRVSTDAGRARLLVACTAATGVCRWLAFRADGAAAVYALFAAMVTALGISATILTADVGQIAGPAETGSFFGLFASVESGTGMIGPVLAGFLSGQHAAASITAVLVLNAAVLAMVAVGYERVVLKQIRQTRKPDKSD